MEGTYPKSLRKINVKEENIKSRFLKATLGWIKYKPLLLYIKNRETYRAEIDAMIGKLQEIVPKLNEIFNDNCFSVLLEELKKYDKDVEQHYKDYIRTNEIWKELKKKINND